MESRQNFTRKVFPPREFARNVIGGHVGKNAICIPVFFVVEPVYFASIEISLDAADTQTAVFAFPIKVCVRKYRYIFFGIGGERNFKLSIFSGESLILGFNSEK